MYRWVDHTAELELRVDADSEAGVFRAALDALGELLGDDEDGDHEPISREVAVEAPDRPALLAAWLEELVYLAESEGLVPERAEPLAVEAGRLTAVVTGRRGAPPHLVKGVTFHRLAFDDADGSWRATVVLDV